MTIHDIPKTERQLESGEIRNEDELSNLTKPLEDISDNVSHFSGNEAGSLFNFGGPHDNLSFKQRLQMRKEKNIHNQ